MHGVAFNAQLIPFCFGDDNEPFFFDSEIAQSWQAGFDKGAQILNNSWANAIPATEINEARYNQVMPRIIEDRSKTGPGRRGICVPDRQRTETRTLGRTRFASRHARTGKRLDCCGRIEKRWQRHQRQVELLRCGGSLVHRCAGEIPVLAKVC